MPRQYSYLQFHSIPTGSPLPSPIPIFAYLSSSYINTSSNLLSIIMYPDIFRITSLIQLQKQTYWRVWNFFFKFYHPPQYSTQDWEYSFINCLFALCFFSPFSLEIIPCQFFEIIILSCNCLVTLTVHSSLFNQFIIKLFNQFAILRHSNIWQ